MPPPGPGSSAVHRFAGAGGPEWYTGAGMSHGMGRSGLLLALVLLWALSTLPQPGWNGLPGPTGIAGIADDAGRRSLSALDAIFGDFISSLAPVLIVLAATAPLREVATAPDAVPAFQTRGPPRR